VMLPAAAASDTWHFERMALKAAMNHLEQRRTNSTPQFVLHEWKYIQRSDMPQDVFILHSRTTNSMGYSLSREYNCVLSRQAIFDLMKKRRFITCTQAFTSSNQRFICMHPLLPAYWMLALSKLFHFITILFYYSCCFLWSIGYQWNAVSLQFRWSYRQYVGLLRRGPIPTQMNPTRE
jgi:hypothetical protein